MMIHSDGRGRRRGRRMRPDGGPADGFGFGPGGGGPAYDPGSAPEFPPAFRGRGGPGFGPGGPAFGPGGPAYGRGGPRFGRGRPAFGRGPWFGPGFGRFGEFAPGFGPGFGRFGPGGPGFGREFSPAGRGFRPGFGPAGCAPGEAGEGVVEGAADGPEGPGDPGFDPGFGPGFGAGGGRRGRGFGPGFVPGPGFGPGFGPGRGFGPRGWFGPGGPGPRGRGHRRRMRGDVRSAVLALLAEEPRHGYAIMSEITERSGGLWRPSPGSVYPVLQQLQDEGLVSVDESEGRRVFSLTQAGRAFVEEHQEEIGRPWEMADPGPGRRFRSLAEAMASLGVAVHQVAGLADDAQTERALAALEEARRTMYRILAGDLADAGPHGAGDDPQSPPWGTAQAGPAGSGNPAAGRPEPGGGVAGRRHDGSAAGPGADDPGADAPGAEDPDPAG